MSDVEILAKTAMVSSERTVSETPQDDVVDEKPKFKQRTKSSERRPEPQQERPKPTTNNSSSSTANSNRFDGIKKWFSDFFD